MKKFTAFIDLKHNNVIGDRVVSQIASFDFSKAQKEIIDDSFSKCNLGEISSCVYDPQNISLCVNGFLNEDGVAWYELGANQLTIGVVIFKVDEHKFECLERVTFSFCKSSMLYSTVLFPESETFNEQFKKLTLSK
jgi:hypothetical protein